jgi:hypothetical protein
MSELRLSRPTRLRFHEVDETPLTPSDPADPTYDAPPRLGTAPPRTAWRSKVARRGHGDHDAVSGSVPSFTIVLLKCRRSEGEGCVDRDRMASLEAGYDHPARLPDGDPTTLPAVIGPSHAVPIHRRQ